MGLVAPRHVGSSRTRARTRVPCIGRRILNHCATGEVLHSLWVKKLSLYLSCNLSFSYPCLLHLFSFFKFWTPPVLRPENDWLSSKTPWPRSSCSPSAPPGARPPVYSSYQSRSSSPAGSQHRAQPSALRSAPTSAFCFLFWWLCCLWPAWFLNISWYLLFPSSLQLFYFFHVYIGMDIHLTKKQIQAH